MGIFGTVKDGREGSLIWMDDVILTKKYQTRFQIMFDITHDTVKRYHIKDGEAKRKIMTIIVNLNITLETQLQSKLITINT